MTTVDDACAELRDILPEAQARTHIPDTDGTTTRAAPSSKPPWNAAVTETLLTAVEGIRQLEASWRTGQPHAIAHTGATIASVTRLAHAQPDTEQRQAVVLITRWTTAILQLAPIDQAERPQRVQATCPYCGFGMMCLYPRSGRVTCLRYGTCQDSDGQHPVGFADRNRLTATPEIVWRDGLIT